jgi:hypothetical protein
MLRHYWVLALFLSLIVSNPRLDFHGSTLAFIAKRKPYYYPFSCLQWKGARPQKRFHYGLARCGGLIGRLIRSGIFVLLFQFSEPMIIVQKLGHFLRVSSMRWPAFAPCVTVPIHKSIFLGFGKLRVWFQYELDQNLRRWFLLCLILSQVHGLMLRELGGGFARHSRAPTSQTACYVVLKPDILVDRIQIIKKLRGHRNAVYCGMPLALFSVVDESPCQLCSRF